MEGDIIYRNDVLELLYEIKDDDTVPKNYGTILDIIRKMRDIPTVSINQDFVNWIEENKEYAANDWSTFDDEQAFGEMVAYGNVLEYLQSHGIIGGDTK